MVRDIPFYAGERSESCGVNENLLPRKIKQRQHFLYFSDSFFATHRLWGKNRNKYFGMRQTGTVFTFLLPGHWRNFLPIGWSLYDERFGRCDPPQWDFPIFFRPHLQTLGPLPSLRSRKNEFDGTNRRRLDAPSSCARSFSANIEGKNARKLQSQKYDFKGVNQFFSPPCGTPLGSIWQIANSTRRDLHNGENRMSIRQ